jgi:hypothetical protein
MEDSQLKQDKEARRWHASWIITGLITIVVAGVTAWTALDMMPLILIVSFCWALTLGLLWILTPLKSHRIAKILVSILLTTCAGFAISWLYSYDRPILIIEIGGVATQNYNNTALGVDVESLVKNEGRQSSFADKWKLTLNIDGTTIEGRELYGQSLPPNAVNEPQLFDQEFPPGKSVRGWLFFGFPALSHDYAAAYFLCGSALMDKVSLQLSVWDSKTRHEYAQTKSLKQLGKEACTPIKPQQPITSTPSRPATRRPASVPGTKTSQTPLSTLPPGTVTQNCEGSNCIAGPNFGNPTVNNFERPYRHLTDGQKSSLRQVADSLPEDASFLHIEIVNDPEALKYGNEIADFFRSKTKTIGVGLSYPQGMPEGVSVLIDSPQDELFPTAQKIANAFSLSGIPVNFSHFEKPKPGHIWILIGVRPEKAN